MMKLSLTRVIHRRVDDDPPASEELQQQDPQLARRMLCHMCHKSVKQESQQQLRHN